MSDRVFKTPYASDTCKSQRQKRFLTPIRCNSDSSDSVTNGSDTDSSDHHVLIIADYEEISRFSKILKCEYLVLEKSYADFVDNSKLLLEAFKKSREECRSLQEKLEAMSYENSDLDKKLAFARKFLDKEKRNTKLAERAKQELEFKLRNLRDMFQDQGSLRHAQEHTLSKFANLETDRIDQEEAPQLSCIPEINSTGSLLSDLSYSKSEDDLDISKAAIGKTWKNHRPSMDAIPEQPAMKKRRSTENKVVEISHTDTVRATTTLSMPKNGPITATSIIEALPSATGTHRIPNYAPSAPPETPQTKKNTESNPEKRESMMETENIRNNNNNYHQKCHSMQKKTVVLPESCSVCQRKMKFGRLAWKCKDCKNHCHEECKDKLPLPCIPVIHTPNQGNGSGGTIGEYTGTTPPMVPPLIIHCVNEIEVRQPEVGLYRVPGSEKDVKTLKDRFLKGKAAPCLKEVDVHVLCGVVKDFLRSLQEPLISRTLWRDFVSAAEDNDVQIIKEKIAQLRQPNRDTLAYMILHLQRISEKKEIKMPVENLAIVFGPTLVGYLTEDFDDKRNKNNFLTETKQQIKVMQFLLGLPPSFWESYVNVTPSCGYSGLQQTPSTDSLMSRSKKTPNRGQTAKRRFFPTPPGNRY